MSDHTELKRLAEAFPSDLDYDSNTEPFFNGPSGESLGGDSTGFYCVYGAPFEIDGDQYDGHTFVETCTADFAKFMVAARDGVLALIAENEALRRDKSEPCDGCFMADAEALRKDRTDWQAECLKRGFEYVRESDDHYVLADVPEMADLLGSMLGVEVRSKENDAYEEANSQLNEQIDGLINTIHAQESMRKDAERLQIAAALVQKLCDTAGNQPSVATGYLHDILAAMGKGEQS